MPMTNQNEEAGNQPPPPASPPPPAQPQPSLADTFANPLLVGTEKKNDNPTLNKAVRPDNHERR